MAFGNCPKSAAQTWRTVNKTWVTDADGSNPRPASVTTVLEDGASQSQVKYNAYDSFGQVTDLLEYNFGAGAPGPLLREVVTAFATLGNIVSRPSRIVIKDGGGNTIARTDFNYDGYGTGGIATISPNPTGHDPAFNSSITVRGNLTSVINYANAPAATGGVTSSFTYDITGNQLTSQIGCCTFSQQNYSATTNYAFPDSTLTGPSGNALSLTSSFTYYPLTGKIATAKDANNQTTSYTYDIADRIITTTLPDGNTISQSYDDASANPATTVSNNFNSLVKVTTKQGTNLTEQVKNGASLISTKTLAADILGRTTSASAPFGPSDTPVYTTYTYDPLGRVTQVTPPGNTGNYQASYGIESSSADGTAHMVQTTTSTDPAGKQRKLYRDSLGLRQVDEPGPSGGAAGMGSVSITGTEHNVSVQNGGGATAGTGSVSVSGSERSTQVLTHSATHASGTVTINGSEQSAQQCPNTCRPPMPCCIVKPWWKLNQPLAEVAAAQCFTIYDSGTVSITVGGFTATANYGNGSTGATIATALAGALSAGSSPVTASASGNIVTITSKGAGSNQNFALSSSSATSDPTDFGVSFWGSNGAALSGGSDNVYSTMYDTGNVTVNVTISGNIYSKASAYGQSSSPASVASDLANKINSDTTLNQLLIASSTGAVLNLTTTATGSSTNDPLSVASATNSPYFQSGSTSFPATPSGSTLTPGANGTVYDAGTVTVSITGFTTTPFKKTVNYSQGSTAVSVASSLAGAFNSDPLSPVTATASSGSFNLVAKTPGSETNYGVQVTSATTQTAYFTQPSFTGSSVSLSGGANPSVSLSSPLSTTYSYDALGRLLQVSQGVQNRVYVYDNLGRLTSAKVPETLNQPTTYTYTDFGSVYQKTDPRGIVTTNTYDPLNRLSQIAYSDGTPTVTYTYGAQGAANFGAGRVTKVVDASGTQTFQYDLMGRSTQVSRAIGSQTYKTSYAYGINEQVSTITYPSGRIVKITPDAIGRPNKIDSNGANILTVGSYNAAGEILGAAYGNGMAASYTYNNQLQLASLVSGSSTTPVLNLTYNYGSQNNGQIVGITDGITPSQSVSYTYDELGRLKTAGTNDVTSPNTWNLEFCYDRYGNRLCELPKAGTAAMPFSEITVDPASNRIVGVQYDAAGNVTNDGLHSYAYNADNQITKVDGAGSYVYDAGGRRVIKNGTVYIYEGANVIAEYPNGAAPGSPSVEYVSSVASFAGGATTYYYSDHLSVRALADAAGNVTGRQAQFPFGELMTGLQTGASTKWQFTSYERDLAPGDSGLDYAQARFYGSRFGRFMSLDALSGNIKNPQSLNRYAYVANDPIDFTDPHGTDLRGNLRCLLNDQGDCVGGNFAGGCPDIDGMLDVGCMGGAGFQGMDVFAVCNNNLCVYNNDGLKGSGNLVDFATLQRDAFSTYGMFGIVHITCVGSMSNPTSSCWQTGAWGFPGGSIPPWLVGYPLKWCFGGDAWCDPSGRIVALRGLIEEPGLILAGTGLGMGLAKEGFALLFAEGETEAGTAIVGEVMGEVGSDDIFVVGHGGELAYEGLPGYSVLNMPASEWSLAANDAWVQAGIDQGARFLVADLETGATLYSEQYGMTVFARELNMLNAAGYTRVGEFMVPPGWH
jgi:RHS repeat-associated protein